MCSALRSGPLPSALVALFVLPIFFAALVASQEDSSGSLHNAPTNQTQTSPYETLFDRRVSMIVDELTGKNTNSILRLLGNLTANGTFQDVDYTSGCNARRANWPAQQHWAHIRPIAAAYADLIPHTSSLEQKPPKQFAGNATVKAGLDAAMNWWFDSDFTSVDCLDKGGVANSSCPCGTPGMWNSNWFPNIVTIPQMVMDTCLMLNASLTDFQRQKCVAIGERADVPVNQSINGLGLVTGANTLDIAYTMTSVGLFKVMNGLQGGGNQIADAYARAHKEIAIHSGPRADGIRPDGSFTQHSGILYDGNYGKAYTASVLNLELVSAGTDYEAAESTRDAFAAHVDGSQWMVYHNAESGVNHWDLSTVGRIIAFPVSSNQATANLKLNLSQVAQLGSEWNNQAITGFVDRMNNNGTSANAAGLVGNRMFWSTDYMVHRGSNYVTTLKMLSNRTLNTECQNSQNPKGFNLGQGVMFNYIKGSEYEDIAASWDWNLLPGLTTAYAAIPLTCNQAGVYGTELFVGGASTGEVGLAAMKYSNPLSPSTLSYQKAWFFFKDGVHQVTISNVNSDANQTEVLSVLDQRRADGPIYVDGNVTAPGSVQFPNATQLWHGGVGYVFDTLATGRGLSELSVGAGNRTGDWSSIGTARGNTTVDTFIAYIRHTRDQLFNPVSYTVYPGTSSVEDFQQKSANRSIAVIRNDVAAAAALDAKKSTMMVVFWGAGNVTVPNDLLPVVAAGDGQDLTVDSSAPVVLVMDLATAKATVADPSQTLSNVTLTLSRPSAKVTVALPSGGDAGKSVDVDFNAPPSTGSRRHRRGGHGARPWRSRGD